MKILIFSWRDIKHPKAGGAEVLTMELATRWVKAGHEVSIVSARFPGAKIRESHLRGGGAPTSRRGDTSEVEEKQETINVFRPAKFYHYSPISYLLFLIKTARFYRKNLADKYDVIIDQVHGLPLFTPLYAKEKVVIFPLEVAQDIWRYEIPFPFWVFGWLLEYAYIKLFRNYQFLAISNSTAQDLKKLSVKKVGVITPGIGFKPKRRIPSKSEKPLIISLSRLTPMKRIEQTIEAFKLVLEQFPHAKLLVIGKGDSKYLRKLKMENEECLPAEASAEAGKMERKVIFTSFVSEKEKQKLLSEAWLLVSTSLREGWGLNVIEAAACGTPSVVYKVPGLVDSVQDKKTGLICSKNTPEELAKNIIKLLKDKKIRLRLSQNALEYSRGFSWDKTAQQTLEVLQKLTSHPQILY